MSKFIPVILNDKDYIVCNIDHISHLYYAHSEWDDIYSYSITLIDGSTFQISDKNQYDKIERILLEYNNE